MAMNSSNPICQIADMLDALYCGALLLERSGRIAHVNARLCQMMRRPAEELVGANVLCLYQGGEQRDELVAALQNFDRPRETEFFLPLPDGSRLPVICSSRPLDAGHMLTEADGGFACRVFGAGPERADYAVVTLVDVSDQKAAEEHLRLQYRTISDLSNTVIDQAMKLREYSRDLEDRVRQRTIELHDAHMEAIYMLAIASEAKDHDTGQHVRRLERWARAIARRLGLPATDVREIGYAAVLHDVGKIHVPDHILNKPGPLDDEERVTMRSHTIAGQRILAPSPFFMRASQVARSHHENWDGSGYPDGLRGDAIPLEGRIVHIADVYDALTHRRVYKPAWSVDVAMAQINDARGRLFEPELVDAFVAVHQEQSMNSERSDATAEATGGITLARTAT
jgi:putative nucleotidyltransferase with HDIG domain